MPNYENQPSEEQAASSAGERRAKPRMPALTIDRYGGRLIYFWFGMRFGALMKLFKRGRYCFTLNCIPDVLLLFLWVPWNSVLYRISEAKYRRARRKLPARRSRRSSSSAIGAPARRFLHDLFSVDPNLAYPTTYECFFPHHFLLTEDMLPKVMKVLLPKKRPQDDVPVGFDRPQEEEFAMMILGAGHALHHPCLAAFRSRRQRLSRLQGPLRSRPEAHGPTPICGSIAGSRSSMAVSAW